MHQVIRVSIMVVYMIAIAAVSAALLGAITGCGGEQVPSVKTAKPDEANMMVSELTVVRNHVAAAKKEIRQLREQLDNVQSEISAIEQQSACAQKVKPLQCSADSLLAIQKDLQAELKVAENTLSERQARMCELMDKILKQ